MAVVNDYICISKQLKNLVKIVTIDADIMFVNNIPFLVTVSQNIVLTT